MPTIRASRSPASSVVLLSLAVLVSGAACGSGTVQPRVLPARAPAPRIERKASFPRAGMLLQASVAVRRWPDRAARRVAILPQFRADNLPTVVFAVAATHDPAGRLWYLVDVPAPGNATHGWVDARATHLHAVRARIVVDRGARTLTLYLRDRLRLRTKVAVGRPGMPTPTGSFYVRAGYHATEPALGAYAFETSAFSKLSEWPGGGIIGIHGTPEPRLLGTAASHGCVRVSNHAARALARLVPVGAAVSIID